MSYARQMLEGDTVSAVDASLLAAAIEALNDCAQACTADADADLHEDDVDSMVACIRLCLDCTDVCRATVDLISRSTTYDNAVIGPLLTSCIAICARCGEECERHGEEHLHCRVCAEACVRCENACRDLLASATS